MAHLFDAHAIVLENPDDEGFSGYMALNDIWTTLDYIAPLLYPDEKTTFDTAVNVHLQHHDPTMSIQTFGAHRWRIFKQLS